MQKEKFKKILSNKIGSQNAQYRSETNLSITFSKVPNTLDKFEYVVKISYSIKNTLNFAITTNT